MSRIHIEQSQIGILKKLIYNLQSGDIFLTKTYESHKKELLKHTELNYDVVNIICDYNDETIQITIKVTISAYSRDLRIYVKLEDYVELIFHCAQIMKVYLNETNSDIIDLYPVKRSYEVINDDLIISFKNNKYLSDWYPNLNLLNFFNCYMNHYYKQNNYFSNASCCFYNDIFIDEDNLINPINHKKLKNIIVITKVLKKQFEKIMKEKDER